MTKRTLFLLLCVLSSLLVLAACSEIAQHSVIQTLVANPAAGQAVALLQDAESASDATPAPGGFSMLATPTLDPIANSPMGTYTAIAKTIEPPTPDPNQYELVLRGKPHFIEFHAWW